MNSKINTASESVQQVKTVKQIRGALTNLPAAADDLPLVVAVPLDDDSYLTYAITACPSFQKTDWGDGLGLVDDTRYVLVDAFAGLLPLRNRLEIHVKGE